MLQWRAPLDCWDRPRSDRPDAECQDEHQAPDQELVDCMTDRMTHEKPRHRAGGRWVHPIPLVELVEYHRSPAATRCVVDRCDDARTKSKPALANDIVAQDIGVGDHHHPPTSKR